MLDTTPDEILDFWFGELDATGRSSPEYASRWFKKDPAFDEAIGQRFAATLAALTAGEGGEWLSKARSALAYVIVIDQFSRNLFRGSGEMFARDPLARAATLAGIERGFDRQLRTDERCFFYMPLMHSETLAEQDRCVALFAGLVDELDGEAREQLSNNLKYARAHRDIIARFGRFPHRNALLGRTSTAEELAFLEQPGSSF